MLKKTRIGFSLICTFLLLASSLASADTSVVGKILEIQNAKNYTYLRLKTAEGEAWAAIPSSSIKVGAMAEIMNPLLMTHFESKDLKRKFDQIYFGTLGGPAAAAHGAMGQSPHGGQPTAKAIDFKTIKVKKAEGTDSRTVAEVYAQKQTLKGKEVLVRGQVVKFLPGIMKKNWVHISDGTGSEKDKNHDLTVTTLDQARVGDTILVKGKLQIDQELGAGYFFPVIVDNARLSK